MSEYRIEKIRRRLRVALTNGNLLEGDVFLRPVSRYLPRPEEPADLLNESEPFFALDRDGEAILVAKRHVASVELPVPEQDDSSFTALGVPVEITLTDGSVCAGSVFLETRTERPRLMDFLNEFDSRFLPVVDARKVLLLNRDTIAHVREVA